jgi:AcrR family transcriptional regulator
MDQGQHKKPHHIQSAKQQASDKEDAIVRDPQKEMMLVAAARLFRERGFAETTQDEIAAGVGLTKPRLYHHFKKGKQEIIKSCVDRALEQWRAAIDQIQNSEPGEAALRLIVERYADIAFGDFGFCAIFIGVNSLALGERDLLLRQKADVDSRFKSLMAAAIPREILSQADSEFLWLTATSLVHGIGLLKDPPAAKQQILSKALGTVLTGSNIKA